MAILQSLDVPIADSNAIVLQHHDPHIIMMLQFNYKQKTTVLQQGFAQPVEHSHLASQMHWRGVLLSALPSQQECQKNHCADPHLANGRAVPFILPDINLLSREDSQSGEWTVAASYVGIEYSVTFRV